MSEQNLPISYVVGSNSWTTEPDAMEKLTKKSLIFELQELPATVRNLLPIFSVNTKKGRYVARKPLAVKLILEGSTYLALNENLEIHGVGSSSQEAQDDLCAHIAHAIVHYELKPLTRVTGVALQMKKKFETTFFHQPL